MRAILGTSLLLLTACGSGSVGIGDGPSRTCPGFGLSDDAISLVAAPIGQPVEAVLTVINDCLEDEGDLTFEVTLSGDPAFTLSETSATVAAGQSTDLVLTFTALTYVESVAELQIVTNIDELGTVIVPLAGIAAADQDGDGFDAIGAGGEDCDDTRPDAFPGATEVWYDGVDGDCSGGSDFDQDGDGQDRSPEGQDCNDLDPLVYGGADELEDVLDNDCDGYVDEDSLRPGDVLVTEVMNDPVAVFDTSGEWFEVINTSTRTIDLVNWDVRDFDGDSFVIDTSLQVAPGERLVFGVEGDPSRNGGVAVDYVYARESFDLENAADAIGFQVDGEVLALLEYDSSWRQLPGQSMQLDADFERPTTGGQRAYWCVSVAFIEEGGDRGTPGGVNRLCPTVDHDGDGVTPAEGDCDDANPDISPKADEIWNGIDDDCDGSVDVSELDDVESAYLDGDRRTYLGYLAGLSIGDVDHDGDDELIVSTTRAGGTVDGLVYTLEAGDASTWADAVSSVDEAEITADHSFDAMGLISRRMADNDGDGKADLLIGGSAGFGGDLSTTPTILMFTSGSISGNLDQDDADAIYTGIRGNYDANRIAGHMDVNGDGTHEIFFIDPNANAPGLLFAGGIYLIDGDGASGTAEIEDVIERSWYGGRLYGRFGNAVDGADLDGDGYDELFGCGQQENFNVGACYMIAGSRDYADSGPMADRADLEITGRSGGERLGYAPRLAFGDFDGNSDVDVVIGNPWRDEALVFFDMATLSGSYDSSDADVAIRPRSTPSYFGLGLDAGDFDGDGTDDLAVGAPDTLFFTGADEPGGVWVWNGDEIAGGATTLDETDVWASVTGMTNSDAFGQGIMAADLEGDGVDDLIVTSPGASTDLGRISIILLD